VTIWQDFGKQFRNGELVTPGLPYRYVLRTMESQDDGGFVLRLKNSRQSQGLP